MYHTSIPPSVSLGRCKLAPMLLNSCNHIFTFRTTQFSTNEFVLTNGKLPKLTNTYTRHLHFLSLSLMPLPLSLSLFFLTNLFIVKFLGSNDYIFIAKYNKNAHNLTPILDVVVDRIAGAHTKCPDRFVL